MHNVLERQCIKTLSVLKENIEIDFWNFIIFCLTLPLHIIISLICYDERFLESQPK